MNARRIGSVRTLQRLYEQEGGYCSRSLEEEVYLAFLLDRSGV